MEVNILKFLKRKRLAFLTVNEVASGRTLKRLRLCISQRVKLTKKEEFWIIWVKGADCCSMDTYEQEIEVKINGEVLGLEEIWSPTWMNSKKLRHRIYKKLLPNCSQKCRRCQWF